MASPSNKKLLIFYVYNILKEYSDENHPLKQQEIIDLIYTKYGMECKRKAISDNIKYLSYELGYSITGVTGKGVYLSKRSFDKNEAYSLADAIFSSKDISNSKACELAEKVFSDYSIYEKKKYGSVYKSEQSQRAESRPLFFAVDELNRAIGEEKKISFKYVTYTFDGKSVRDIKASPYHLISNSGKYYLVCSVCAEDGLECYCSEYMEGVRVLDGEGGTSNEPCEPIEKISGCEHGFDISEYAKQALNGTSTAIADIAIGSESALNDAYDYFGKDIRQRKDEQTIVTVKANEQRIIAWILQHGADCELIWPDETREKIKAAAKHLANIYNGLSR